MILPKGYKMLEWIESTGSQYVDTGLVPTVNTKVALRAETETTQASNEWLFGSRNESSGGRFSVYRNTNSKWGFGFGSTTNTSFSASTVGYVDILINGNSCTINGETITASESTLTSTTNMYIFMENRVGEASQGITAKLYGCQIWDNGTLVRQFVPCIDPNGEVGLYDTVEGKFYGNAGTGSFVAGDELLEVECIESTGTQYIDTGFVPNQDTKVIIDFEQIQGGGYGIFGSRTKYQSNGFTFLWNSNNYWASAYGTGGGVTSVKGDNERHIIIKDRGDSYLDGELLISVTSDDFTCPHSAYLFCYYDGSLSPAISSLTAAKIYSCQIYDNDVLVRHYIPMVTGGGVAGLYDLVNNTFSVDAAGGNFVAGARIVELPAGYTQVEYIESSGTQYVDTGFKPNQDTRVVMDAQTVDSAQAFFFGGRTTSNSNTFSFLLNGDTALRTDYNVSPHTSISVDSSTDRFVIDKNKNLTKVTNSEEIYSAEQTYSNFSSTDNLVLLAVNTAGTVTLNISAKLYSCRIYDNGTLARDFIPCTNASGAGGLYDLVNGVFYANAGTGAFSVGDVVDAESQFPGDETILVTPPNFRTEEVTESSFSLAWDEVGAATGYKLYRNLALISDQTETEYTDTGLVQFASYQYDVVAYNDTEQSAPATLVVNTAISDFALALVTDRTEADVARVKSLAAKWMDETITDEEKAEYLSFMMKGSYNFTDLNRVERAVEYINDLINNIQADVNSALRENNVASDAFWVVPFAQLVLEVKTNWGIADLPTESDLARYLDSVAQTTDRIPIEKNLPASVANYLKHDGANEIEKALLAEYNAGVSYRENMKQLVSNTAKAFVQSGEIYGGEF